MGRRASELKTQPVFPSTTIATPQEQLPQIPTTFTQQACVQTHCVPHTPFSPGETMLKRRTQHPAAGVA